MEVLEDIAALQAALEERDVERVRTAIIQQLQRTWSEETEQALQEALEALDGQAITDETIAQMQGQLRASLGPRFARLQSEMLTSAFEAANLIGKQQAGVDIEIAFGFEDRRAINAVTENSTFWIGNHYDRDVQGRVRKVAEDLLEEGAGAFRTGRRFAEEFGEEFNKSQNYWDLLGTVTTTRSRSFGQLQSLIDAGAEAVEIDAVIDHRTSDICEAADGIVIPIDAIRGQRDSLLEADDPTAWKEIAPWPSDDEAKDWGTEDFIENGVMIPPLHGHCRSGLVIAER